MEFSGYNTVCQQYVSPYIKKANNCLKRMADLAAKRNKCQEKK